jgi:hypothetical protein
MMNQLIPSLLLLILLSATSQTIVEKSVNIYLPVHPQ